MKRTDRERGEQTSATLTQTLLVMAGCSALFALTAYASAPGWWSGVLNGHSPNDYMVANQGQLKQFTVQAVSYMDANLPSGAGTDLDNLVAGWEQDYATNNYSDSTNLYAPYKPSDYQAVNIGQLKYIANMIWSRLVSSGYTNAAPSWLHPNASSDYMVANIGQLKEVFDFDLTGDLNAVTNLTATTNADGSVTLTWTLLPNSNSNAITIAGQNADGTWTTLDTVSGTATSDTLSASEASSYSMLGASNSLVNLLGSLLLGGINNPNGPPPPRYAVVDLGDISPANVNNNGDVVGQKLEGGTNIIFWHAGTPTTVPLPAPPPPWYPLDYISSVSTFVTGMNDSGAIIGWALYNYQDPFYGLEPTDQCILWNNTQTDPTQPPNFSPLVLATGAAVNDVGLSNAGAYILLTFPPSFYYNNSTAAPIPIGYDPVIDLNSVNFGGYGDVDNSRGLYSENESEATAMNRLGDLAGVSSQDSVIVPLLNGGVIFSDVVTNPVHWVYGSSNGVLTEPTILPFSWYVTAFTDSMFSPIYVGIDSPGDPLPVTGHLYDPGQTPSDISLGTYLPASISTPTDATKVQIIANGSDHLPYLYEKQVVPPATQPTWITTPLSLNRLIPAKSGWQLNPVTSMNNYGAIVGTATYTPTGTTDPIAAGSHGVLLLPIQCRVVNRDDPTQTWTNNVLQNGIPPVVYGGIQAGDMVGWKLGSTDSWTSATFTWSVTDSAGNPVTDFNGTTITGPSGAGINEWRIATWTAGGNDPHNQWLTWKPGTYTIKCVVGSSTCKFTQTVGTRANDVVAIAWINPAGVSLPTSGVDSDVLSTFPVSGTFGGPLARIFTSAYVGSLASGITLRPVVAASLSSADDTYILNWLFHFAGNTAPPTSFADEPTLDAFVATKTNYKLVNRLQVRWQENAAKFVGTPFQIKNGVTVAIGTTTDPIWGLPAPGSAGPANGRIRITGNNTYNQMNDGSPDAVAVAAFNTLESPNIWSDIGSMFSEGPTTGSSYALAQQVYPTYFIYVRNSDGSFTQVDTKTQATNPSGNFSTTPYPGSSIPAWIIP